ncbi:hypothetical protein CMT45_10860 [Elizabethkingia anophelis]|nr:hypothetical protein [Elizabethkingia anophelis]
MEIITLATATLTLVKPFIEKVGEGSARKIGEDIWNLLKKPFQKNNKDIEKINKEDLQAALVDILNKDKDFKNELESFITNIQTNVENVNQTIVNNESIEKQVNIGNNIGNITL